MSEYIQVLVSFVQHGSLRRVAFKFKESRMPPGFREYPMEFRDELAQLMTKAGAEVWVPFVEITFIEGVITYEDKTG